MNDEEEFLFDRPDYVRSGVGAMFACRRRRLPFAGMSQTNRGGRADQAFTCTVFDTTSTNGFFSVYG